jgi:hypothetical protein
MKQHLLRHCPNTGKRTDIGVVRQADRAPFLRTHAAAFGTTILIP